MIKLTAGSCGMRCICGGWSLCTMTSIWFACEIGRYRCSFCLIDWLTDVRQGGDVDGTVCGNVTFSAWRLWHHKFCRVCTVRRLIADTQCTVWVAWAGRNTPCHPPATWRHHVMSGKMREMWNGTCFQLPTSLHVLNRIFSFSPFITACLTVCVIQYDHLALKLGPDVEELKFRHRLWTLISVARICKRCAVNP